MALRDHSVMIDELWHRLLNINFQQDECIFKMLLWFPKPQATEVMPKTWRP